MNRPRLEFAPRPVITGYSDHELSELKESLKKNRCIGPKTVAAVIARMEAAEQVINELSCGSREDLQVELDAWRKACGK